MVDLVAPYCAIPRDYLSDTHPLRAMGFLVAQHGQLDAILPPPFLSVSPLESMRSAGAIPPPQKGYLSDTCAKPMKTRQVGAIPPLRCYLERVLQAIWGVISHWAAKLVEHLVVEHDWSPLCLIDHWKSVAYFLYIPTMNLLDNTSPLYLAARSQRYGCECECEF